MGQNQLLGARGEELAAQYLRRNGLQILDRNWRCSRGEVDIIAADGKTIVFCEVKTRTSLAFGFPLEAVTQRKLTHMRTVALTWLSQNRMPVGGIRLDVVGVVLTNSPSISWAKGVGS